jgi:uncharacterized membrane protein
MDASGQPRERGKRRRSRVRSDGGTTTDDGGETPLEQLVAGVVVGTILLVAFGLLAAGYGWFWVAFPVGFAGVLPAALALVKLYERRRERSPKSEGADDEREDALAVLRERYARGDIDEGEFERRVEWLLETESVDAAAAHVRERERERERQGASADAGTAETEAEADPDRRR